QVLVSRIVAQPSQQRINQKRQRAGVVIVERDLQPLESFVFLTAHRVNLSNLIGQHIAAIGDQVVQCRVCRLPISTHILRDREFETAITLIGLQLSFSQCRLAVAALSSNQRLPSMGGSRRGLQLSRLPCYGVCLIQFSSEEENSSQGALRNNGKRVEFNCLATLPLGLINSPQITDQAGEHIVGSWIARRKFFRTL